MDDRPLAELIAETRALAAHHRKLRDELRLVCERSAEARRRAAEDRRARERDTPDRRETKGDRRQR
jgi:hypothetical protein